MDYPYDPVNENEHGDGKQHLPSSNYTCTINFNPTRFIHFRKLLDVGDTYALGLFVAALVVSESSLIEASILTCLFNAFLLIGRYQIMDECNKLRFKQMKTLHKSNLIKSMMHIDLFYGFRAWMRNLVICGMAVLGIRLIVIMFELNITRDPTREQYNSIFIVNLISFFASIFGVYAYLMARSAVRVPSEIVKNLPDHKRPSELELGCLLLNPHFGKQLEEEFNKCHVRIRWVDETYQEIFSPHK